MKGLYLVIFSCTQLQQSRVERVCVVVVQLWYSSAWTSPTLKPQSWSRCHVFTLPVQFTWAPSASLSLSRIRLITFGVAHNLPYCHSKYSLGGRSDSAAGKALLHLCARSTFWVQTNLGIAGCDPKAKHTSRYSLGPSINWSSRAQYPRISLLFPPNPSMGKRVATVRSFRTVNN